MPVEYGQAAGPVPYACAVFTCACGARQIEPDASRSAPPGWTVDPEAGVRCPRCAASGEPGTRGAREDGTAPEDG